MSDGGEEQHRWEHYAETLAGSAESAAPEELRMLTAIQHHLEDGGLER